MVNRRMIPVFLVAAVFAVLMSVAWASDSADETLSQRLQEVDDQLESIQANLDVRGINGGAILDRVGG